MRGQQGREVWNKYYVSSACAHLEQKICIDLFATVLTTEELHLNCPWVVVIPLGQHKQNDVLHVLYRVQNPARIETRRNAVVIFFSATRWWQVYCCVISDNKSFKLSMNKGLFKHPVHFVLHLVCINDNYFKIWKYWVWETLTTTLEHLKSNFHTNDSTPPPPPGASPN